MFVNQRNKQFQKQIEIPILNVDCFEIHSFFSTWFFRDGPTGNVHPLAADQSFSSVEDPDNISYATDFNVSQDEYLSPGNRYASLDNYSYTCLHKLLILLIRILFDGIYLILYCFIFSPLLLCIVSKIIF